MGNDGETLVVADSVQQFQSNPTGMMNNSTKMFSFPPFFINAFHQYLPLF